MDEKSIAGHGRIRISKLQTHGAGSPRSV